MYPCPGQGPCPAAAGAAVGFVLVSAEQGGGQRGHGFIEGHKTESVTGQSVRMLISTVVSVVTKVVAFAGCVNGGLIVGTGTV